LDQLEVLLNGRGAPHNPAGKKFNRDELTRAMLAVIGQPVAGMEDLVRRVGQLVPVGLLSNTNPLHYELCQSNLPVLRLIPLHLLSFQLRSLKPEPAIFEKVLQRVRITAADILYIDDLEENLRAAEEAGFTSHLFRDRSQLQALLRDLTLI
jgi:HAD superfamily hydrolase (TIGR01509 family)